MNIFGYLEQWQKMEEEIRAAATCRQKEVQVRDFLWRAGIRQPEEIDLAALQRYFQGLAEHQATISLHHRKSALSCFCSFLVKAGRLRGNPCQKLRLPAVVHRPPEFLTAEEIDTLIQAARKPEAALAVQVGLFTGIRSDEGRCLTWQQIDLERRLLRIYGHEGFVVKTGKYRVIPIMDRFWPVLAARRAERQPGLEDYLIPHPRDPRQPLPRSSWDRLLRPLRNLFPGRVVTWNTLRHTFASLLIQQGAGLYQVASWLGNTPGIAERHYCNAGQQFDADINRIGSGILTQLQYRS